VTHAHGARARHVPGRRIADERRVGRRHPQLLDGPVEDAGVGFPASDATRIDDDAEELTDSRVVADGLEVAVEVRDDSQPVSAAKPRQQRRVAAQGLEGTLEEAARDPADQCVVAVQPEPPGEARGETKDGRRGRADERVVGRVEERVESRGLEPDALGTIEAGKPLLPGHTVGVQGAAEVKEHRAFHRPPRQRRDGPEPRGAPRSRVG